MRSKNEENIQHHGMRGRFRELLIETVLAPWLPPYAACGTGMIIDAEDRSREATQDDIIIFDRSLVPGVLASMASSEGVFPLEGVLGRVEVKSTLTRDGLRQAIIAANEIGAMTFAAAAGRTYPLPISLIFAFSSDMGAGADAELDRLFDVTRELGVSWGGNYPELASPISGLCVIGKGFWAASTVSESGWVRMKPNHSEGDEVMVFLGAISNTCFINHAIRQGRDPSLSTEAGIGNYALGFDIYEKIRLSNIPVRPPAAH